ncbi:MAG TPA: DUF2065 domain-containing protein [Pseudomonadales bacterium]
MWQTFLIALCLVMVIEGILPFLAPRLWRDAMQAATTLPDRQLRMIGLASMLAGTVLLYIIH